MKYGLIFLPALFLACGSNTETTETDSTNQDTAIVEQPVADSASSLEMDWRNFKIAVLEKDEPAVISFLNTDEIDAQSLVQMINEEWVKSKLDTTDFTDLTDSEYKGIAVKEFRADEDYTDEDGNSYETAIFLYFEEQIEGLRLIGFLVAG